MAELDSESGKKSMQERLFPQIAHFDVRFTRTSYQKIVRGLRATTGDKISLIGGTLGLFTGISFVSVVEAVFWVGRCLARLLGQKRK